MPIRIDRVYTKGGDKGETSLVGGKRLRKSHPRIDAYGQVDELNAVIGICRSFLTHSSLKKEIIKNIDEHLGKVQQDLFDMGADLATPPGHKGAKPKLKPERIKEMEKMMDQWQESLDTLTSFVLPGGSLLPSHIHFARTICRRAERKVVQLHEKEEILGETLTYLNRLSDFLFVLSRFVAKNLGEAEVLWEY